MADVYDLIGKVNNLHDPQPWLNKHSVVLSVTITSTIFSLLCAAGRLHVRFLVVRAPGWDDFIIILVMVTSLALCVTTCMSLKHGLGKHFISMPLNEMQEFIHVFYLCNGMYPMSTTLIKLALLLQYLRLYTSRFHMRLVTIAAITFTSLWGLAYSLLAWIPCYPVAAFWNLSLSATARWGFGSHNTAIFTNTFISHVTSNFILDLVVYLIPLPLLLDSSLNGRSRVGVLILLILGAIVNSLSIWRLAKIIETRAGTYPTLDPSWYGSGPIVLAVVEVDLALVCASLPIFWPIIEQNITKIFISQSFEITYEDVDPGKDEKEFFSPHVAVRTRTID